MAESDIPERRTIGFVLGGGGHLGANEVGTLTALKEHRAELIDPSIADHQGRIVKLTGDGMLVEFPSLVSAVDCATSIQREMRGRNQSAGNRSRSN